MGVGEADYRRKGDRLTDDEYLVLLVDESLENMSNHNVRSTNQLSYSRDDGELIVTKPMRSDRNHGRPHLPGQCACDSTNDAAKDQGVVGQSDQSKQNREDRESDRCDQGG